MHRFYRQRGQAIIELLVALPVLLTLIFGLVSVGQILLANYTVNQAARAAAHQAAISGGEANAAQQAAENVLDSGVGTSYERANIEVSCARNPCRRYDQVTVDVVYRGELWTPIPFFEQFRIAARASRAAERDQQ